VSENSNFFKIKTCEKNYRRHIVDFGVSQSRLPPRIIFIYITQSLRKSAVSDRLTGYYRPYGDCISPIGATDNSPPFIAGWRNNDQGRYFISRRQKKTPNQYIDPRISLFIHKTADHPLPAKDGIFIQAGLLTLGLSCKSAPSHSMAEQWYKADFIPDYSGGPIPDSHGIPC